MTEGEVTTVQRFYLAGLSAGPRDYIHWFHVDDADQRGAAMISDAAVDAAFTEISDALPTPREGEGHDRAAVAAAVQRALKAPLWTDRGHNERVLGPVTGAYLAGMLDRLRALPTRTESGAAGRLIIQPGTRLALLPWELLPLGDGRRLIDVVDLHAVAGSLPLLWERKRRPDPTVAAGLDRPLRLVDPYTGGQVVRGMPVAERWAPLLADAPWQPGERVTRDDLARELTRTAPEYSRWLFFGHCTPPAEGEPSTMGLLLSDPYQPGNGIATVVDDDDPTHTLRPLTAADLILGDDGQHGWDKWPMPPRVAIIACDSGGDARHFEVLGLVPALVNAGAEYVTATRWMLPSDHYSHGATTTLALAVDTAHQASDPVPALQTWQHQQQQAWLDNPGDPAHSPLLWAGVTTYHAPTITD